MIIIESLGKKLAQNCCHHHQSVRLITYLHSGPPHFKDTVQKALHLDSFGIDLPEDVVLQCLTHKSFAHGSKPYNEKLNLLGSQFLKYQASIHSLRQNNVLSPVARGKVQRPLNNLNFTNLGTQLSKFLISKDAIAEFIKEKHLGGRPPPTCH
nr:ASB_HP1_G0027160.mRNA.1.CDS.1 [Saccharomyces cerevisiae]